MSILMPNFMLHLLRIIQCNSSGEKLQGLSLSILAYPLFKTMISEFQECLKELA